MTPAPGDIVKSRLAQNPSNPNARPATPEPTISSGIEPGHAHHGNSSPRAQSAGSATSERRKRRSTERGEQLKLDNEKKAARREKIIRTRKRNLAMRAHIESQGNNDGGNSNGGGEHGTGHGNNVELPESHPHRGRSTTVRELSRSPTPGSTDRKRSSPPPIEPRSQPTGDSQYTFVYETLDHEGLVRYAQDRLHINLCSSDTQTILALLRLSEGKQAPEVGPSGLPPSTEVVCQPLGVGGGWHLDSNNLGMGASASRGNKRGADASATNEPDKRQRVVPANDTATEDETEDKTEDKTLEQRSGPARAAAERIVHSGSGTVPNRPRPSLPGTMPPPPTREPTSTTAPAPGTPEQNQSFGATQSQAGRLMPQLPRLLSPPRGPVHARLRGKLLHRFAESFERAVEEAEVAGSPSAAPVPSAVDEEVDELAPTDAEEVPETDQEDALPSWPDSFVRNPRPRSPSPLRPAPAPALDPTPTPAHTHGAATQRTYKKGRSHVASQPGPKAGSSANNPEPIERPDSPSWNPADLIQRELARAQAAKAELQAKKAKAQAKSRSDKDTRRHLFADASQAPISRPQVRPQVGASGTRRVNPISAAAQDMANFQEAVRQGNATGFVQSVTRQNERKGRCAPVPRPRHKFLEDNEEDLAHAEARANSEWPPDTSSRGRTRQPKPLARNVSGIERLILTIAKIHLFAYAISEGAWQTRATFLLWAEAVYYATWMMELPTVPFVKPPHKHLEIMVNALATMRGKCKEYSRSFVEHVHQFVRRIHDQQVIQENLRKFNLLFPNNFHCSSYCPRAGHYENPDVGHAIASMLFHSPGSVGNMFPDYFVKMPLPMVAYVLSIWQFCIEEWSSGTQRNGDLGMAAMSERFEANMSGLMDLARRAPNRLHTLQKRWRKYVREYSGAALPDTDDEEVGAEVEADESEIRPDTPEPEIEADVQMVDAMSVEELNAQLFETARQESIRERMREITAREQLDLEDGELGDDDEPRSPPPVPDEFNEYGYVTARSKGKGRAN